MILGLVPKAWSNVPDDLEPISRIICPNDYSLNSNILPILASGGDGLATLFVYDLRKALFLESFL